MNTDNRDQLRVRSRTVRVAAGRGLRMIEFKQQINRLAQQAEAPPLYDPSFTKQRDGEASANEH